MEIYHYSKKGVYIKSGVARPDPLDKGKFLIPSNSTTEKPMEPKKGNEVVFNNGWEERKIKTPAPSKYHVWSDENGWEISIENQELLDRDIVNSEEKRKRSDLLSEIEFKIQAEMRLQAIDSLKTKGEIPQDY